MPTNIPPDIFRAARVIPNKLKSKWPLNTKITIMTKASNTHFAAIRREIF